MSLSAGELVLPTMGSDGGITPGGLGVGEGGEKAQGLVKQVYGAVGGWIGDTAEVLGWGGSSGGRRGQIGYR